MEMIEIQEKITPIMEKYGIKRASVFGSVARGEDRADSDIDVLVELGDQSMGLFKYSRFVDELEESLGRKVDVVTKINKFIKPYIIPDLKEIYERR